MATHSTLSSLFTDTADKIRELTGNTEKIVADNFPITVENLKGTNSNISITRVINEDSTLADVGTGVVHVTIPQGYYCDSTVSDRAVTVSTTFEDLLPDIDTTTTAESADIKNGQQAYDDKGNLLTGTMTVNSQNITITQPSDPITINQGYHDGTGKVTINLTSGSVSNPTAVKGTVSDNSITITPKVNSTTGWITGVTGQAGTAVTVKAGDLVSGNIELTPTTTEQKSIDVTNYKTVSIAAVSSDTAKSTLGKGSCTVSGGDLSGGDLSAGDGQVEVSNSTVTPAVEGTGTSTSSQSTYGISSTKPSSGTDGTNYLTFNPNAAVTTNGTAKGCGSVTRGVITRSAITDTHKAGYIEESVNTTDAATIASGSKTSNWSSAKSTNPSIANGTNWYVPIVSATATKGTASASASIAKQPSATTTASSATVSITATGISDGISTTETSYYINAKANATSGSASAASGYSTASASATGGSASVGKGITSGSSATGGNASDSDTSTEITASSEEKTASDEKTTYLAAASRTYSGGDVTATASGEVATVPKVTIGGETNMATVSTGTYYFTRTGEVGTTGKVTNKADASSKDVTYTASAGYQPKVTTSTIAKSGQKATQATSSTDVTPTWDGNGTVYIQEGSCTISGGTLSGGTLSIDSNYTGTPTVSLKSGSSSNMSNITIGDSTDTTNYPYYFKVDGSSSALSGNTKVSRTAVTRAAVTEKRTEGYITARNATVIDSDSATIAADSQSPTVTVKAGSKSAYINLKGASISSSGSVSTTPSVTIGGTTNMSTASSGTYYFTRTGSVSAGSIQTTYAVGTAGYTDTKDATNSGTVSVTPTVSDDATIYIPTAKFSSSGNVVYCSTAGYIPAGSASSGIATVGTSLGATTYNTSTSDQVIAAGKYLAGAQTIKAVTTSNLSAENIISGVTVTVGDVNNTARIASVTGTADYIKTVTSVPTEKETSIIYNSTDGYYYIWK